jgi:phenylacetate-CoA ligase
VWPLGGNCPSCGALHISDDIAAVECVNPETGEQLAEGGTGEIVFTNLIGDTQPLLRYRSRDVGG